MYLTFYGLKEKPFNVSPLRRDVEHLLSFARYIRDLFLR